MERRMKAEFASAYMSNAQGYKPYGPQIQVTVWRVVPDVRETGPNIYSVNYLAMAVEQFAGPCAKRSRTVVMRLPDEWQPFWRRFLKLFGL